MPGTERLSPQQSIEQVDGVHGAQVAVAARDEVTPRLARVHADLAPDNAARMGSSMNNLFPSPVLMHRVLCAASSHWCAS
jgi:hypothetical protein